MRLQKPSFRHFDERPGQTYRSFRCSVVKRDKNACRFTVCVGTLNPHRGQAAPQKKTSLYNALFYERFYTEALIAKAPFSSACICPVYNRKYLFKKSLFISFSERTIAATMVLRELPLSAVTNSHQTFPSVPQILPHPFPPLLCHRGCPWDLEGCHLPPDVLMWFNSLPSISPPPPQTTVSSETPTPAPQPTSASQHQGPSQLVSHLTPSSKNQGHVIHLQLICRTNSPVFHVPAISTQTRFKPLVPLARR